jgi:hypothetical protein
MDGDYTSGTTKINVAVDRLPRFTCLSNDWGAVGGGNVNTNARSGHPSDSHAIADGGGGGGDAKSADGLDRDTHGPEHEGTIHLNCESIEQLHRAYADAAHRGYVRRCYSR